MGRDIAFDDTKPTISTAMMFMRDLTQGSLRRSNGGSTVVVSYGEAMVSDNHKSLWNSTLWRSNGVLL